MLITRSIAIGARVGNSVAKALAIFTIKLRRKDPMDDLFQFFLCSQKSVKCFFVFIRRVEGGFFKYGTGII